MAPCTRTHVWTHRPRSLAALARFGTNSNRRRGFQGRSTGTMEPAWLLVPKRAKAARLRGASVYLRHAAVADASCCRRVAALYMAATGQSTCPCLVSLL